MKRLLLLASFALGCAAGEDLDTAGGARTDSGGPDEDVSGADVADTSSDEDSSVAATDSSVAATDSSVAATDTGTKVDTGVVVTDTGGGGPITGGPCISGAKGATAFRIRWVDSGGKATVSYEVTGLPDKSGFKVGAYAMSFGYTPTYSDKFLGEGGLQMDSGVFVDIDFSMIGVPAMKSATLSLYGRSFNTTASGSFAWNTFDGAGTSGSISNVAPYHWDGTSVISGIPTGKVHKLRIKPGPPSGSLVVHRIELCIET